ncbi:MAG: SPOR domain-containing protein [Deltaproteobacteria bacterium]|jgi:cell division protein FtsN|nr:SPOR domain-containing protein [Deltaproteobacteria bacterium]
MTQSPQQRDDKGAGASRAERKGLLGKTVTISLSLPKAVFGASLFFFVLIWAFIFGIMLGRGHNPEETIPGLAKVMPSPSAPAEAPPQGDAGAVLRPRDLQYHDTLKGKDVPAKPPAAVQPPTASPSPAPSQPAPSPTVPSPPAAQRPTPAPSPPSVPERPQSAPKPVTAGETKAGQRQTLYNYVYQVAAFTNGAAAETLRKRLQQDGLSVKVAESVSNTTTWYRIMVAFKGTPDDTNKLRDALAAHGIRTVILREKTPAR